MDYSQLSDFEINKRVAEIVYSIEVVADDFYAKDVPFAYHKDGQVFIFIDEPLSGDWRSYDPCHNPADAWPIIVDNEISLNSYSSTWEASYEYDAPIGAFGTDELVTKAIEGKNPLRTAMIAFLMKQEHANA